MIPRPVRAIAGVAMVTVSSYILATMLDAHGLVILLASLLLPAGFVVLFWKSI